VERTVQREVTSAEHAALVMEIQDVLRMTGQTTVLGGGFTWAPPLAQAGGMPWGGMPARTEGRQVTVTIAADAGRTRIRVEEQLGPAMGGAPVAGIATAALAAMASVAGLVVIRAGGELGMAIVAAPAVVIVAVGVVFAGRVYRNRLVQSHGPELAALAEHLAVRIASKRPALPTPPPA
jgi:hypothetical protein